MIEGKHTRLLMRINVSATDALLEAPCQTGTGKETMDTLIAPVPTMG